MAISPDNFQLLLRRAVNNEKPGTFSDGEELYLVAEGGGTAGAGAAGAAVAIHDGIFIAKELKENGGNFIQAYDALKKHQRVCLQTGREQSEIRAGDYFNGMIGASAGAPILAYFVAGQGYNGARIFFEDLPDPRFLDLKRGLRYAAEEILGLKHLIKPVMDLDFLSDVILGKFDPTKKLDVNKVLGYAGSLGFLAMDVSTKTLRNLNDYKNANDLMASMMTACRIPGVTGIPDLLGARLYDAARFGQRNPIGTIPDYENKRVIVLSSRPVGSSPRHEGPQKAMDDLTTEGTRSIADKSRGLVESLREGQELVAFAHEQNALEEDRVEKSQKNPLHTYLGTPWATARISSSCQNAEVLRNAVLDGYCSTMDKMRRAMIMEGLVNDPGTAKKTYIEPPAHWNAPPKEPEPTFSQRLLSRFIRRPAMKRDI